jgi:hypothetical protein
VCGRRRRTLGRALGRLLASGIHREEQKKCAESSATDHPLRIPLKNCPGAMAKQHESCWMPLFPRIFPEERIVP